MYYSGLVISFRKRPFLRWVLCGVLLLWGMRVLMQYWIVQRNPVVHHLPIRLLCLSGMPFPPWGEDTTVQLLFLRESPFVFSGKTWRAQARCLSPEFRGSVWLYVRQKPQENTRAFLASVRCFAHGREDLYLRGIMARAMAEGALFESLEDGGFSGNDPELLAKMKRFCEKGGRMQALFADGRDRVTGHWRTLFGRWKLNPSEQALCFAILFGDKTKLEEEVKRDFSAAGAMHVLAVSGMHVAILYLLFSRLLLVSEPSKKSMWGRKGLLTLFLLAYAWLCNFSHAVVRAVGMFGLTLWGNRVNRRSDPLNILCFVAIVQLCWDPAACFQLGFQLSYLAVASILLFEPRIRKVLLNWMASRRMRQRMSAPLATISVGLAANLGTLPLVALYFGRIPTYFLLTGVLTAWPSTLLLSGLVLAVPLTEIFPDAWVAGGIKAGVWLFEKPVHLVASLPFAQLEIQDFGKMKCLAAYLGVIGIYLYGSQAQQAKAWMCWLLALALFLWSH